MSGTAGHTVYPLQAQLATFIVIICHAPPFGRAAYATPSGICGIVVLWQISPSALLLTCAEVCTCKADVAAWWQAAKRLVTLHVQECDVIHVTMSVKALAWEGDAIATASAIWGSSADVDTSTTWNKP
jgi:hypothetical protein